MKKTVFSSIALLTCSFVVTLCSVYLERTERVDDPNCLPITLVACEPFYQVSGGFPIAYLFDEPGVSVPGYLAFAEDRLSVPRFLADWVIHALVITGIVALAMRVHYRIVSAD